MAWRIDRDYLAEAGDVSRVGFGAGTLQGETWRFRLRDEDGEIHYGGTFDRAAADDDMADDGSGLYTAWQFGMSDTGATDLEMSRAAALKLGFAREEHVDRHTRDGWTTIYG